MLLLNLIVLFSVSLGFVSEILIDHLIGAGQLHTAYRLLFNSLNWGLVVSFCITLVTATTVQWSLCLFTQIIGLDSTLLAMAGGSWLLGVYFGFGLVGVWIAHAAVEWLRGLTMAARWFCGGWAPAKRVRRSLLSTHRLRGAEL